MKVLIVNSLTPFIANGAEELAKNLEKNLIKVGCEAEILRIPFQDQPSQRILSQMLMVRAFELFNADRVIALKFPAYLIRHPNKTIWLLDQYRQAYDLYDAGQSQITKNKEGDSLRQSIIKADNETFAESRRIFANSEGTRKRLLRYNGFESELLIPPINDEELFQDKGTGDYLFVAGPINERKRQHLLVEAIALCKSKLKLLIAGQPDSPNDEQKLKELVEKLDLKDRVILDFGFLPRELYAKYLNHSAAVAYLPYDQDFLGYVTMEAAIAGKAVITTKDSGGVLDLVKDHETGWVAEPNADSLAQAIDALAMNLSLAKQYGASAKTLWQSLGINWPETVETLLQ